MAERVVIDTGPIVAILCREDAEHTKCVALLQSLDAELCTCWPVISEAVFLLEGRNDRVQSLLKMLETGAIHIVSLGAASETILWFTTFYKRFAEHSPDFADAAIMFLAEQNNIQRIFTLVYRDFTVYRTSDDRALEIAYPM